MSGNMVDSGIGQLPGGHDSGSFLNAKLLALMKPSLMKPLYSE